MSGKKGLRCVYCGGKVRVVKVCKKSGSGFEKYEVRVCKDCGREQG